MAGVGVKLNRIFQKNTLTADMAGFAYSTTITVAPMFLVIFTLFLMELVLGFSRIGYAARELFSCTILYTFIFALLTASPFNAVLSRYMSDVIYEERYDDILACYYVESPLNVDSAPWWEFLLPLGALCWRCLHCLAFTGSAAIWDWCWFSMP